MSSRGIISCATRTLLCAATAELWANKEENKLGETFLDSSVFPLKLVSLGILLIGICEVLDQKLRLV